MKMFPLTWIYQCDKHIQEGIGGGGDGNIFFCKIKSILAIGQCAFLYIKKALPVVKQEISSIALVNDYPNGVYPLKGVIQCGNYLNEDETR